MKVLVLSDTPWSHDNSFGNSFSNIFEGIDDIEVANIACRPGHPTSYVVKRYFQITEKALLKNILNKNVQTGIEIPIEESDTEEIYSENIKGRNFGRKKRWQILFWIRDMIWKIGRWKSQELKDFIDDFKPDIMFQPVYFSSYLNDMSAFIKKYTNVPMLGYISDDCYTLKQFSLSPLYWIDRLYKRRKVKKTIEQCEILYVISDVQKAEYEKVFTPPCKVLTKCADFSDDKRPEYKEPGEVLKMTYAGNVSKGRYEILAELAKAVEEANKDSKKFELDVYTLSPLTNEQKASLSTEAVHLYPPVSYDEIREIQKNSDILVHVEGFTLREKLAVHQSFSTKIVDYLETNRCILAIGDDYCSSIQYFIKNKCGAVATSKSQIKDELVKLDKNRNLLKEYADNAWLSGKSHHNKDDIQNMVCEDMKKTVMKKKGM